MQIHRPSSLNLTFPGDAPSSGSNKPATPETPAAGKVAQRAAAVAAPAAPVVAPRAQGVVLTLQSNDPTVSPESPRSPPVYARPVAPGAPKFDLNDMSLENQMELGRNQGVFTRITLSKDGVLLAKPDPAHRVNSPEFVTAAVSNMKDFEDGLALLKEHTAEPGFKAVDFLSAKLRGFQQVAAKLNVFA